MGKYDRSELTKIAWFLGILAAPTEIAIGLSYIFSDIKSDQLFGIISIIEGFFALSGLLLIDVIYGHPIDIKPDSFKKLESNTLSRIGYIFISLLLIQILFQFPLTVRTVHKALAIIFAGVAEELFFRGLLITPFMKLGMSQEKFKLFKRPGKNGYYVEISLIEIIGILLSSIAFVALHFNYYGNLSLMLTVFVSGIILGFFYQKDKDITANILAHLLLNTWVVIQTFYMLSF